MLGTSVHVMFCAKRYSSLSRLRGALDFLDVVLFLIFWSPKGPGGLGPSKPFAGG